MPGPPGDTSDIDRKRGFVRGVGWRHGAQDNITRLKSLRIGLSRPVSPKIVESRPQVVQVWIEPETVGATAPRSPTQILTVHGQTTFPDPTDIVWTANDSLDMVARLAIAGSRVLIRVHMGILFDEQSQIFSAAPDALVGIDTSPHVPGGVLESWFFVTQG